jgi:hypothetical protein
MMVEVMLVPFFPRRKPFLKEGIVLWLCMVRDCSVSERGDYERVKRRLQVDVL